MSEVLINNNDWLKIAHPPTEEDGDGEVVYVRIKNTNIGVSTNPGNTSSASFSDTIGLDVFNSIGVKRVLNWHNCYSFGNGVESNRIADVFNMPQITPGVKVSTIFEEYKEEHRKHGLIYSGLYNSTSGVNNLNQFIQAEKITKDINPIYGSIQKLHTRDTDLITLCEDKVLKILANKDALYNADGNPQLTATNRVLGQAVPFIGEFGISKNPESFVSEAYRSYFTDKQRGAVMRLSKDGLTPISMHGMKDWFRDNLSTNRVNLLGENILSSNDNWDLLNTSNAKVENGVAILGYYNNNVFNSRYGKASYLKKDNILEIGKKYRLQYDVVSHGGLQHEDGFGFRRIFIANNHQGTSAHLPGPTMTQSAIAGSHINVTWIANRTSLVLQQYQVNQSGGGYYDGVKDSQTTTIQEWIGIQRNEDGSAVPYTWNGGNYLYGGIVTITNLVLEEVKIEPKIIGSYDDRQDEYNVTIRSATPKTISFREDVTGWVSFKSFFPENAISCANDYYTIKDGMLWQHHVQGVNSNTFYGEQTNSSLNVILNDFPGSIKSFHTLDYEGSQSRIEGIRTVEVTGVEYVGGVNDGRYFFFEESNMNSLLNQSDSATWSAVGTGTAIGNPEKAVVMKQYRNNILIHSGLTMLWDSSGYASINSPSGGPTKGSGRRTMPDGNWGTASSLSDFEVGDIITTEQQEKTVNHFNSMPKDGWYVSSIETDKQKGSLPEFIEKEGKWFNYIKGIDSDIDSTTDFGSFDVQGIGNIESMDHAGVVTINGNQPQNNWNSNPKHIWLDASPPAIIAVGMDITDSAGLIPPNTTITQIAFEPFTQNWYIRISQATTAFMAGWQPLTVAHGAIITFTNNINSSLQIGDVLYFETTSEMLGEEIVTNGYFSVIEGAGWDGQGARDFITNAGSVIIGDNTATYSAITQPDVLTIGREYEIRVEVLSSSQPSSSWPYISINNNDNNATHSANYHYIGNDIGSFTYRWKANVTKLELYASGHPVYGETMEIDNVSVKEFISGNVFGFSRIESDQLQKCGGVISLTSNTVTVDSSGVLPSAQDYIMFAKNHAVNTSSLLGYYANIKLENNSKRKIEIFSLNSEITESSK